MLNRYGMDRFKKAQSAEPFSVNAAPGTLLASSPLLAAPKDNPSPSQPPQPQPPSAGRFTTPGNGQSSWQPPDWTVDPKPGIYWLEVMKDGETLDKIPLDKRRHIFGRQVLACDFVLDHPSVSRQHAAVVQHKNGSIFVIDLGSVHGTFVANERLTKDSPLELEVGQSLRFAASTRSYILRKSAPATLQISTPPANIALPPPPDPSDEEAVVAYNTMLNRLNVINFNNPSSSPSQLSNESDLGTERPGKKPRKSRVTFRDQYDGILVEVVGVSDGIDVGTEPGPIGVKEGSLVGKYESLVQITVIPKGQEEAKRKAESSLRKSVTHKLQECLEKVKSPAKGGLYGDLYGDSFSGQVGASWANSTKLEDDNSSALRMEKDASINISISSLVNLEMQRDQNKFNSSFDNDDLFGDDDE